MKNKLLIITIREFVKAIKTRSFWLMTLGFPLIYAVIFGVVHYSQTETTKTLEAQNANISHIYIFDESALITSNLNNAKIEFVASADA